jgi:outer membrane murein-binding lipoprotein Lpp
MGTEPGNVATDAATLKAKLDALVKDAEEAEEKAVAARRRARAAHALLEEEE